MKQTKLLLATIAMLWCSLTASAHDFEVDGIYYNITSETDLTVEVTYQGSSYDEYSNEYSGAVTIPAAVTYNGKTYSVVNIGKYAFHYCTSLTAITIPESSQLTSIESYAFGLCGSLTAITIPESVTSIEDHAFYFCRGLTSINVREGNTTYDSRDNCNAIIETSSNCLILGCSATIIPEGMTSIGDYAFLGCSSLTAITIPESVTSIGDHAFYNCSNLTAITIPESSQLTSIGRYAFGLCGRLTAITIPKSVTSIGNWAFQYCSSLTAITIPESVTSIGSSAFDNCTSLKEIVFEEGSETLSLGFNEHNSNGDGQGLFYDCPLEKVYIGRNLSYYNSQSYGYSPFYNKTNLTSVSIGDSVTSIGNYAFNGCTSLKELIIEDGSTTLSLGYNEYNSNGDGQGLFYDCPLEKVYIGRNLSYFNNQMHGYSPFYNKTNLTSVSIGDSVTSIREYAFYGCSSLASITIPESSQLISIGHYAFSGCSSLTSITIPRGVTSIYGYAFDNCTSLKEIVFEEGSQTLSLGYNEYNSNGDGQGLFYDCPLEKVYMGRNLSYFNDQMRGYSPFYNKTNLTSVSIGDSVTSIEGYAFSGCSSLTSITIPQGATSIGEYAFDNCTSLKEIVFEDGSQTLSLGYNEYNSNGDGQGLFYDCPLEKVYMGRNLSYSNDQMHGYSPFYNKTNLTSVSIGDSVTSIGHYAFSGCSSLTSITIPESSQLTSIGRSAFHDCSSLTSIIIPEGVTSIGSYAFYGCSSLASITIPESSQLTSIDSYAFYDCSSITSIIIPEGVTSIANSTFYGCSSLTSITIPEGVTRIYGSAFDNCTSLKEIVFEEGSQTLSLGYNEYNSNGDGQSLFYDCPLEKVYVGRNLSYSNSKPYGYSPFYNKNNLTSVSIGDSVTSIEGYAFSGCSSLTSITIPEGVTSIGSSAFYGCSSLTSITIPKGATSIGEYAFDNCTSLKEIVFEEGSETLSLGYNEYNSNGDGQGLFYDCPLEKVYMGRNLSYSNDQMHGYSPFYNKTNLTSVSIGDSVTSIGHYAFSGCSSLTSITIPESSQLTSIGRSAFHDCSSLTSITIPESVTSIREYAFYGCSSLTSITIPESSQLTSIDSYAFSGCSSITSIIIPEGVTSIGNSTFYGCSSLTSITIPEGVTRIYGSAFDNCTSLKEIVFEDGSQTLSLGYNEYNSNGDDQSLFYDCPLEKVYIGRNLSYFNDQMHGYSPFYNKTNLTSVSIGDSVTSIGNYAFSGCSSITSIIIPESSQLTCIGSYAFYDCSSITSITIPKSVTSIGNYAFTGCTGELIMNYQSPTFFYDEGYYGIFHGSKFTKATIGDSVTSIGPYAFSGCSSLTSIIIPESVTSIKENVFSGCSSLTSITIPEGVTSIGVAAFDNCTSLKEIVFEEGSQTLSLGYNEYNSNGDGQSLFYDCPLEKVYMGRNLSYSNDQMRGYSPFYNKTNLTSVSIGDSVTSIEGYAFSGCSGLTSIIIPESVTSIREYAFYGCSSLTSITIPESSQLTSIERCAFYDCSSLASITIPESVTSIWGYAFYGCSSLTSITIPEGVNTIGPNAFYGCTGELIVNCNISSAWTDDEGRYGIFHGSKFTKVTIGDNVTRIGDYAFDNCTSLKEIVFEEGSQTLSLGYNEYNSNGDGQALFYDCPLEKVYMGRNLSYYNHLQYGYSPFCNQSKLVSVIIGDNVNSIGDDTFNGCTSLKELIIKDSSSTLSLGYNSNNSSGNDQNLFYDCPLEKVYLGRNLNYDYSPFVGKINLTSMTIGDSVNSIEDNLFLGCSSLTSITIGEGVTSIGNAAFSGCSSLTSITIPEGVTAIGNYAFNGCTSLKELIIEDGSTTLSLGYNPTERDYYLAGLFSYCPLEKVHLGRNLNYYSELQYGYSPFYNQSKLVSVSIGDSVTSIEDYAFSYCNFASISIPASVTDIGICAFNNCNRLTEVHIKSIEAWCNIKFADHTSNPLYYAHHLYLDGELVTELMIPEGVTSIGHYAFRGGSSLISITIPESVMSIEDNAFIDCSNVENLVVKGSAMPHVPSDKLKKIVLYSPEPLQSKGFSSTVYQNCMLYVPQQGLARYQVVEPWAYFWNIAALETGNIAPAELPEDDSDPIIYDLRGQRVDVPTRGNIYIVNGRKVLY